MLRRQPPPASPGFRKPVTAIDKVFLAFDQLRPPFVNQLVVDGVGTIDRQALRVAVRRAAEANPGARLRLDGRLGRMAWVPGPTPSVVAFTRANWNGSSEAGATFLERHLDAQRGPSCEVQYVSDGTRSSLIFRSLHGVMDGVGTLFWAQDTLRALRGEPLVGHPSALTDSDFGAGQNDEPMAFPPRDALHPCGRADAPTSDEGFVWRRTRLSKVTTAPIVATLAVALAAEARRHGSGPVRFNIPADLRFFKKHERTTGNAIGTLFPDVGPDATVESVAADLKQRLRAAEHARTPGPYLALRWIPIPVLVALFKRAFAEEHVSGRYGVTSTISFLGAVEPASLAAPGFAPETAFWIPPTADQSCFVTCNQFGDHHELVLSLPRVLASGGRIERLEAQLVEALSAD